jgi:hypothetical protein
LSETIQKEIRSALTIQVQLERNTDEKGRPLPRTEFKIEDIYLPDHWSEFLPKFAGALRGMQETIDKADNKRLKQITAISNVLFGVEDSLKALAAVSDHIKTLPISVERKQIEENSDEISD